MYIDHRGTVADGDAAAVAAADVANNVASTNSAVAASCGADEMMDMSWNDVTDITRRQRTNSCDESYEFDIHTSPSSQRHQSSDYNELLRKLTGSYFARVFNSNNKKGF